MKKQAPIHPEEFSSVTKAMQKEETGSSPIVTLDYDHGVLKLKGRSNPENSLKFYRQIFEMVESYLQQPPSKLTILMQLDYFNSGSEKCLFDLFKIIKKNKSKDMDIVVKWYVDNDDSDMKEKGEDFQSLMEFPFEFLPYEVSKN
ncbi:MAG: DUF1987 domain-containing protein [Cyclobacteriaceae bacterium]|nr:DUF1987 domain-containing protein [Cyclobacteriaceae bacterium]